MGSQGSKNRPVRTLLAASIHLGLAGLASAAFAQSAPAEPEQTPQSLPQVSVSAQPENDASTEYTGLYTAHGNSSTATRLNMGLKDTPQSVSVITHQQIEDLGLQTIDDVLLHTTGVTAATAAIGGGYQFTARGFDITNMQVDGLQGSYRSAGRGSFNASVLDSALYDRVEVVRGATGLVTGVGDPSATVNMIRKRPEKVFTGTLSAEVGSWSHRRGVADMSVPLTEDGRIRARLIGTEQKAHSFRKFKRDERTTLSGVVEADLTRQTMLTLGHDYQKTDNEGGESQALPLFDAQGNRINMPRSTSFTPRWTRWNKRYNNSFIYLDHNFDNGWHAKAAYSHNKNTGDVRITAVDASWYINADGSGQQINPNLAGNGYRYQDNFELQANGPFQLLGREHQLTVGVNGTRSRDTEPGMRFANTKKYTIEDIYSWDGYMPEPEVIWTGAKTRTTTKQTGAYAGARLNVLDPLNVIVGARLSNYKTERDNYGTNGQYTNTTGQLRNKNEVTPFFGVTYDLTPEVTAYASYAKIFKPQNYRDKNNDYLDPITGRNLEVGVKAELLEKRLRVNFAVFEAKQNNLAVLDTSVPDNYLPDGSNAYLSSGAGNRSRGFEAEVSGSLSRNWQVFAAYSNTQTKNGEGEVINTYIPRQMVKLGTSYRFSGALQGLHVASTVHWSSSRDMWTSGRTYSIPGVGPVSATAPSYATVALHAGYQINDQWQARLTINNLFDKHYYDNFVAFRAQYGSPRNVQASVRYQW